jgi:hypothetical protein
LIIDYFEQDFKLFFHTIKKRILPQNTMFSAEQSAIIGAIQSEKNSSHEIVIITDSLSTIMAAESRTSTKNPKTKTIRKMLEQERPRITLLWAPSHKGIPGNQRYPPDDQKKWLTEEDFRKRDQRWKNRNNEMKERKPDVDRKEDTERNAKERASGNIQTPNRIYEGHPRPQDGRGWQSTMPQHRSIRPPHTVGMQRN